MLWPRYNCITVYKYEFDKLPTILKNYEFGIMFLKTKSIVFLEFEIVPLFPPPPL